MPERVFIVGCGYVGRRVAVRCRDAGSMVVGLVRSEESLAELEELGIIPVWGDLDDPETLDLSLAEGARVIYLAPPPKRGEKDPRMRNFLEALSGVETPPEKLLYMSTTGVYGDCGGEWVTEETPLNPETPRARRRAAAERAVTRYGRDTGVATVILRVAGIYGPGRLPVDRLRSGQPVILEDQSSPGNRIQVEDLVMVCLAALDRAEPGSVFNVADGNPSSTTDYMNRVADLVNLPRPPQIPREEAIKVLPPMTVSFMIESRRIDVSRLKNALGLEFRYAELDAGLRASLDEA